ncbi:MAG: YihA family ribosome biogenesis GTP-binding protein [Alphaproteobacteria bacterium]|nr:MAG: YihA family ribosome biogenesis GTP-binding protein [Alphaproteobacteria bacterium]
MTRPDAETGASSRNRTAEAATAADAHTARAIEAGRHLFAQSCAFVGAAADESGLPLTPLPEVAFAGRSNVGKSSLINALTGRKTLARTSGTPGRTRQINFFALGERLMLVDLPGYGYARASKREVRHWTALVHRYLKGRAQLRRVCLLIDARHGLKDVDRRVMDELDEAAVSYQAVLTKADKLRPEAVATTREAITQVLAQRPAAHPQCIATSAVTGLGIAELRAALATLAIAAERG